MELDGFTVAAQIGNFLLLLWLLKRFLYRPILEAMTARQQRIAAALAEAQAQAAAAEALRQDYLARQQELAASRETELARAQEEVAAQQQTWLTQARTEVNQARERWRAELEREQRDYRQALQREAAQRLLALTRRALHDLANAELEAHMVPILLAQLQTLDTETRQTLARAARDGCVILTAFPLPEPQRRTLTAGLQRLREVLKQPQYRPLPAAEQIAVLLAVTQGEFDAVPLERIGEAEQAVRAVIVTTLLSEWLFIAFFRACAESLASEHASRLLAMQNAERNIEDKLTVLHTLYHQQRQEAITTELLDVIVGCEAMMGLSQPASA